MYERLNEAICFATACHAGQVRKLANTPYILHPLEVASIIGTITNDEDTMIAGLLHDTVEDAGVTFDEIREKFGLTVLLIEHHMNLVMDISDRIYVIDFGKQIACGTPAEIQSNQKVIDAYLGASDENE